MIKMPHKRNIISTCLITLSLAGCDLLSPEYNSSICTADKKAIDTLTNDFHKQWDVPTLREMEGDQFCLRYASGEGEPAERIRKWARNRMVEIKTKNRPSHPALLLKTKKKEEIITNAFNEAGVPYKLEEHEGYRYIHWDKKDKESVSKIFQKTLGFSLEEPEAPDTDKWAISEQAAKDIILRNYPGILNNAYMNNPVVANVSGGANVDKEEVSHFWLVQILCNKGGVHALFLVHPDSGKIKQWQEPNSKNSKQCK